MGADYHVWWSWTRSPRTEHHQKVSDADIAIAVYVGKTLRWTRPPLGENQEKVPYPHLAIAVDISSQTWLAVIRDAIVVDILAFAELDATDCNSNGILYTFEIQLGESEDVNNDGVSGDW